MTRNSQDKPTITMLEGFDGVRYRWQPYIEATDSHGIGSMVWFVLKYSFGIDPVWGSNATRALVTVLPDGGIRIVDNGVGLPVDAISEERPSWEAVFTKMNFGCTPASDLFVVSAFSRCLVAETMKDGHVWRQEFHGDEHWSDLEIVGESPAHGLVITFWPRTDIFGPSIDPTELADGMDHFLKSRPHGSVTLVDERNPGTASSIRCWEPDETPKPRRRSHRRRA